MKKCLFAIMLLASFNAYSMECSIKKISTALALPAEKIGCLKKSVERTQEGISSAIIKYKCTDLVTGLCNLLCRDESDIVCAGRIFKAIPKYADEKIGACGYFWGPVTDLFNTKPKGQSDAKCVHAYSEYIAGFTNDANFVQVKGAVGEQMKSSVIIEDDELVVEEELAPAIISEEADPGYHDKYVPVPKSKEKYIPVQKTKLQNSSK